MAGERYPFPRAYRLTKTDEFSSVFGFRRAIKGQYFMLHFGAPQSVEPAAANPGARLGIVVGKKLVKQAVRRNTLKRIAREQFRLQRDSLPPRDLILRLTRKPAEASRQMMASEILSLLQKCRHQDRRSSPTANG